LDSVAGSLRLTRSIGNCLMRGLNWRNIPIALVDARKGEQRAHACAKACYRQLTSGLHCNGTYIAGLLLPPLNVDADYEEPHGRQYFPKAEYQRVGEQISGEFG
jgi:hypothetical protein